MKHNRGSLPGPFAGEAVIGVGGRDPRVIGSPLAVKVSLAVPPSSRRTARAALTRQTVISGPPDPRA